MNSARLVEVTLRLRTDASAGKVQWGEKELNTVDDGEEWMKDVIKLVSRFGADYFAGISVACRIGGISGNGDNPYEGRYDDSDPCRSISPNFQFR